MPYDKTVIVCVSPRKKCRLPRRVLSVDTCLHMELEDRDPQSTRKEMPPLPDDDPELEQEFEEMARWLLDVYLWRLQQERKAGSDGRVDAHPPSLTM